MIQRAGRASFTIPDEWRDKSLYSYSPSDITLKITLFFDDEVDEPTADEVIRDRVETMQDVLPGFRIEQDITPIRIDDREGKTIVFDVEEVDDVKRTRLAVAMLGIRLAIVITALAPLDRWAEMEAIWNRFISDFKLSDSNLPVAGGENG